MSEFNPDLQLHLAIQKALLKEVTPELVAVTCGREGTLIRVIAYYDCPVSEQHWEHIRVIGAEVIGDFPDGYHIHEIAKQASAGLNVLKFWAFMRADAS